VWFLLQRPEGMDVKGMNFAFTYTWWGKWCLAFLGRAMIAIRNIASTEDYF
jgi:hypothetical protein